MAKETIAGLAKRLGISKASVSYALNGQPGVSEATRRRVLALAEELEWYPSSLARALSRSRAGAVGMVLSVDPLRLGTEPYHMGLLAGIETALAEADMALLLRMIPKDPARERTIYERWAGERKVDGVLLLDHLHGDPRPHLLARLGLPFVLHGAPRTEGDVEYSGTTTDHGADSATIVSHLQGLGHRRIAHVSGPRTFVHEEARIDGVAACAAQFGMDVAQYEADYSLESGRAAVGKLLLDVPAEERATAVVVGSDLMAMGALLALRSHGVRCPEDVMLVSWDDSLHCELASPSVTALSRNPWMHGSVAAELLLTLLETGETRTHFMPPGELVARTSTASEPSPSD